MKLAPAMADGCYPSPAKLNLFLHITGRRADGYHTLQTLFQFLDWGDRLRIHARRDGQLHLHTPTPGIQAQDNLVIKAARALQQHAGSRLGAEFWLDKQLPMGAGLGGGSSNAATTLVVLNQLWGLHVSIAELLQLAVKLGADVPVFVQGQAAWAEGVGEQLSPVELPQPHFVVLVPDCHISTAALFANPSLQRNHPPVTLNDYSAGRCGNDFWPCVQAHYPAVQAAHGWLSRHAQAHLTGTGSAVFAVMPSHEQAEQLAAQAPAQWRPRVVQGCNRSPLYAANAGHAQPTHLK